MFLSAFYKCKAAFKKKNLHTSLKATLPGIQKHLDHQWAELSF